MAGSEGKAGLRIVADPGLVHLDGKLRWAIEGLPQTLGRNVVCGATKLDAMQTGDFAPARVQVSIFPTIAIFLVNEPERSIPDQAEEIYLAAAQYLRQLSDAFFNAAMAARAESAKAAIGEGTEGTP